MSEEFKIEATMQDRVKRAEARSRVETIRNLAERLFVANYPNTRNGWTEEYMEKTAFDAAEAFVTEAEQRAEQCK